MKKASKEIKFTTKLESYEAQMIDDDAFCILHKLKDMFFIEFSSGLFMEYTAKEINKFYKIYYNKQPMEIIDQTVVRKSR